MRNVFYLALASFALGMVVCASVFPKSLEFILCAVYFAVVFYKAVIRKKYFCALALLFAVLGFFSYNGISNIKMSQINEYLNAECEIYATVISSERSTTGVKYTAKAKKINTEDKNVKILIYGPRDTDFKHGDKIILKNVKPFVPQSLNNFDYNLYLKAQGIFAAVYSSNENISFIEEGKGLVRSIYILRDEISHKISENLNKECAGIVNAVITGDKSGISRKIKNDFSTAGISHLLAVSGLHITLLVSYLGIFLQKDSYVFSRFIKPVFSIAVTIFAMLVTGFGYSVIRAGIMIILTNLAKIFGREKNSVNSLCIAAALIIAVNPYSVFDVGFELSFFATLGIILFSNKICEKIIRFVRIKRLSESFSTTVSAQIFTLPLIVVYYNSISVYGIIVNLIAVPLFTVLLGTAVLFLPITFFAPFAVKLFRGNLYVLIKLLLFCAQAFSRFPFAVIPITGDEFAVLIFIFLGIFMAYKSIKETKFKKTGTVLLCIGFIGVFAFYFEPKSLEVAFLDVGQGSCSYIKTPNGKNILIDCGVSKYYSKNDVGRYVAQPYLASKGAKRIDYVFLTHYHDDHFSGILSLMEDGAVDTLILPKVKNSDDLEDYLKIKKAAIMNDVEINYFSRGSTLLVDDIKITALSPQKNTYLTQNNESLVLKLNYYDTAFLFTGDIENDLMKNLKADEITADVVQSPHHGSKYSDDESFFKNTCADYAVISSGKGNSYGHPDKSHLDSLLSNNIKILRTDQNGTICFKVDSSGNMKYKTEERVG